MATWPVFKIIYSGFKKKQKYTHSCEVQQTNKTIARHCLGRNIILSFLHFSQHRTDITLNIMLIFSIETLKVTNSGFSLFLGPMEKLV
jgi:hypothetical protein